MNREVHVRFWEGLAVRFRWALTLFGDRVNDVGVVTVFENFREFSLPGS